MNYPFNAVILQPHWFKYVKGIVHQKCKSYHLLTIMLFQTSMTFFLLRNIKEDILKNDGNQTTSVTTDIHCIRIKIDIYEK